MSNDQPHRRVGARARRTRPSRSWVRSSIDLRRRPVHRTARPVIQAFGFWAGIDIYVNARTRVIVDGVGVMGAFVQARDKVEAELGPESPVVRVTGPGADGRCHRAAPADARRAQAPPSRSLTVVFELPDAYVWDFWTAYDDRSRRHHLFFLHAPNALGDPDLRHRNARVGHAVSDDLVYWERLDDPLPRARRVRRPGAVDRLRRARARRLVAVHDRPHQLRRRHRAADRRRRARPDLESWTRTGLTLEGGEAWRDPWVVRDEGGLWHMYITARDPETGSGVVGHAISVDLLDWEVGPPLSDATGFFTQLETIQVVQVEGRWVLLFSCLSTEMPGAAAGSGGVWSVPVDGPGAPVDVASAVRVTDERLVRRQGGPRPRHGVLHGLPQPGARRPFRRRGDRPDPRHLAPGRAWTAARRARSVPRSARIWLVPPLAPTVSRVTYNGSSGTFLPVRR